MTTYTLSDNIVLKHHWQGQRWEIALDDLSEQTIESLLHFGFNRKMENSTTSARDSSVATKRKCKDNVFEAIRSGTWMHRESLASISAVEWRAIEIAKRKGRVDPAAPKRKALAEWQAIDEDWRNRAMAVAQAEIAGEADL